MTDIYGSRRHIIVEGCDGSGKDFLIDQLTGDGLPARMPFPLTIHQRASTSLGGPVPELDSWVSQDLIHLKSIDFKRNDPSRPRYIYNRHPLISELIYSKYRFENRGLSGMFRNRTWVQASSRHLANYIVLVICQPPKDVVGKNIEHSRGAHLPGVETNWGHIYDEYSNLVWPGATVRYDYTQHNVDELVTTLLRNVEHY